MKVFLTSIMLLKFTIILVFYYLLSLCQAQDLTFRIWGGKPIEIETTPYMISFQVQDKHVCGGTILTEDVILTAAHCVVWGLNHNGIKIRAGSTLWQSGGTLLEARDTLVHPQYSDTTWGNDLALVWLNGKLSFDEYIQAVPAMAAQDEPVPPPGTMAYAAGWGRMEDQSFPAALRGVDLPIYDSDDCVQAWLGYRKNITSRMICAGVVDKDTCERDSGTGLVVQGKLVGVANFGPTPCGQPNLPGVYARVASFRNWIDDSIKNHAP